MEMKVINKTNLMSKNNTNANPTPRMDVGLGPWFIALMFNNTLNRYEFAIHTYAYRVAWFKGDGWFNVQLVGPFDSIAQAQYVFEEWKQDGQKNQSKLLEKGFEVVSKYKGLKMWSEYVKSKEELKPKLLIRDLRLKN
jgi:hypothetical protein